MLATTNQTENFRWSRNAQRHISFVLLGGYFCLLERRRHPRRQIFKFGMLKYRCLAKLGVVKNMSPAGAMIAVENSVGIPDDLTLDIEANLRTGPCHVVWKNAKQIGVRYL
jgi:hypothetical protein